MKNSLYIFLSLQIPFGKHGKSERSLFLGVCRKNSQNNKGLSNNGQSGKRGISIRIVGSIAEVRGFDHIEHKNFFLFSVLKKIDCEHQS